MTTAETALRARDPGWMEWTVPLLWPALKAWFRPEVRGLDRIPPHGAVLLVGNHSGGNVAPDTIVFATAFIRRFGTRRPFFQLAHKLVMAAPWLGLLRRYGTLTASPENARAALETGAPSPRAGRRWRSARAAARRRSRAGRRRRVRQGRARP
jgi:1-acyl-sn-glycerol-3-phosphate acyltransferase